MTRVSALELGKYNIRVNAVNPTVVMTPMSEWYWGREDVGGPLLDAMPLARWATEEDCAAPIVSPSVGCISNDFGRMPSNRWRLHCRLTRNPS